MLESTNITMIKSTDELITVLLQNFLAATKSKIMSKKSSLMLINLTWN